MPIERQRIWHVGTVAASLELVGIVLAAMLAADHRRALAARWRVGLLIGSTLTIWAGAGCAAATGPGWWDGLVVLAGITWFYAVVELVGPPGRPPRSTRGGGDRP